MDLPLVISPAKSAVWASISWYEPGVTTPCSHMPLLAWQSSEPPVFLFPSNLTVPVTWPWLTSHVTLPVAFSGTGAADAVPASASGASGAAAAGPLATVIFFNLFPYLGGS